MRISKCIRLCIASFLFGLLFPCTIPMPAVSGSNGPNDPGADQAKRQRFKIEIKGDPILPKDEVLEKIGAKRGRRPGASSLRALQSMYYMRGYLFAEFHLEATPDSSKFLLEIDAGGQAKYGGVSFRGSSAFPAKRLQQITRAIPGKSFNPVDLSKGIEKLLHLYDESGFPFAQVWVDSLAMHPGAGTVDMAFFIMDGGRKRLTSVKIEGLKKTRENVALKLSGLEIGSYYDGGVVEEAIKRLQSFDVFSSVSRAGVRMSPGGDGVEVIIEVKEPIQTNSLQLALGYAKEEEGRPRVLSGLARLDLVNMGGSLKDLNVLWNNDGSGRNRMKITFNNRHFLGRSTGMGFSLEQIGLDTLYTWQSLGIETKVPLHSGRSAVASLHFALNADRNVFSEGELRRSWRFRQTTGFSVAWGEWETGYLDLESRFSFARKKQYKRSRASGENMTQYIFDVKIEGDINLGFSHLNDLTAYRGIESSEDLIPLSEQFYLGGAGTLRGYRENQFHGSRIAYSRLELRLGRSRFEHAYIFADAGYVFQAKKNADGSISRENLLRTGYGFGLRTGTKVGDVDLSFGVGEKVSLRQTKVHIILGHRF